MPYTLSATKRTTKGAAVRNASQIPGVVYGAGQKSESLTLAFREFTKLFKEAGESTLIDLQIDGSDAGKILIQEVQTDPVSDSIIHVDLRRIDMKKVITAPVTLKFIGEAPVVKEQGGTLVTNFTTVEVKCLPKDLVSYIDVSLAGLKTFDDTIKVKDLVLPTGITIVNPAAEDLVAKATPALTEEEIKAMEEANAVADVSKITSVKEEKKAEEAAKAAEEGAAAIAETKDAKDVKKEEKKK